MTLPADAAPALADHLPWAAAPASRVAPARLRERLRLAALAASGLAVLVTGTLALRDLPGSIAGLATRSAGTAFLSTATCADWRAAGPTRRTAIAGALAVAATAPDPENQGATLDEAGTFGLFARACSTRASQSALLYETYNRAASFQGVTMGQMVRPGGFGTAPHR